MTKNRSRNPHTKKSARTAPTTKPATSRASPAKRAKTKTPSSAPVAAKKSPGVAQTKKPARKKIKAATNKLSVTQRIIDALENLKGKDIVCLDVRKLTDVTDTLVIVSGTSSRHVKSLADNAALELKKAGHRAYNIEGADAGEWVLVDFGDVVLHVMQPHIREFYDLEKLWSTPAVDPGSATNNPAKVAANKKPSSKKPADNSTE